MNMTFYALFLAMTRTNALGRLQRLERLAAQLKADAFCTVSDLARAHGVSTRTIARDLELMREQGMMIEADRGRGGGVRLDRNWGVGRLTLSYAEAVDLLISITVAERMKSPMFLANLGAVRRQIIASFSPKQRDRVSRIRDRILIGNTASTYVQADVVTPDTRVVQALHRAFLEQHRLEITYRREDGAPSARTIEPQYLFLQYPVWYVLAIDHLRAAPRMFRCDRILSASMTETPFRLLPQETFASPLLEQALSE